MAKKSVQSTSPTKAFTGETVIRFDEVSFEWGHNKPILDGVSFNVRRGTKVTIMGQNGAGKPLFFDLFWGTTNLSQVRFIWPKVHCRDGAPGHSSRSIGAHRS